MSQPGASEPAAAQLEPTPDTAEVTRAEPASAAAAPTKPSVPGEVTGAPAAAALKKPSAWGAVRNIAAAGNRRGSHGLPMVAVSAEGAATDSPSARRRNPFRIASAFIRVMSEHLSKSSASALRQANQIDAFRSGAMRAQASKLGAMKAINRARTLFLSLGIVIYIFGGGALFSHLEGWDFATACYFSTVTMTTVGYGDLNPSTPGSKCAAVLYACCGVVVVSAQLVKLITQAKDIAARKMELVVTALNEGEGDESERPGAKVIAKQRWGLQRSILVWVSIFVCFQLGAAAIFVQLAPGLSFGDAFYHTCTTALTVGYGVVASQLPPTTGMRVWAVCHLLLSVAGLAAMIADLQRLAGKEKARRRQRDLLAARLDEELIRTLDRDGNGVDRIEYVVGMLTHMGVISWSDVQPFLDQFDELDVDGNGHLDRADLERMAEMQAAAEAARRESHQRKAGGRGHGFVVMAAIRARKDAQRARRSEQSPRRSISWRPSQRGSISAREGESGKDAHAVPAPVEAV